MRLYALQTSQQRAKANKRCGSSLLDGFCVRYEETTVDEKNNSICCHLCDVLILAAHLVLVIGSIAAVVMFSGCL